jgi:hypothetical protein
MEIISSPLPAIPVDVGDASMQRDLALKLAAMALASQAARPEAGTPAGTDTAARTLMSTLTALARSQDSLGQLLADLSRPEALARVPAEVRADIARVLILARPVVQAGLTRPAPATPQTDPSAAPRGPALTAPADPLTVNLPPLADALQRLEASLKAWQPAQGQLPTPTTLQQRNALPPAETRTRLPDLAAPPSPADALALKPRQKGVEFAEPSDADAKQATIKQEKEGGVMALVVRGPSGEVLRAFADSAACIRPAISAPLIGASGAVASNGSSVAYFALRSATCPIACRSS